MVTYRKKYMPRRYKKKTKKPMVSSAIKKYVKSATKSFKPEMKRYIDTFVETTIENTTSSAYLYEPAIAQGTGAYQRVGNSIKMGGVSARVLMKNNSTNTAFVRVVLLKVPSDTDMAVATSEFYKDTNSAGSTGTISVSGTTANNLVLQINDAKFKVLYDRVFKLGATGSVDGKDCIFLQKFWKLGFQTVKFDGGASGAGNSSVRYFLCYIHSESALDSAGGAVELSGQHKWHFIDA